MKQVIMLMNTTSFIASLSLKTGDNLSPAQSVPNWNQLKAELFLNALLEVITESLILNRKFYLHKFGAFFLLLSNAPFSPKKEIVFKPSAALLRYISNAACDNASSASD
jgi:nucleoid DNA-binding protein